MNGDVDFEIQHNLLQTYRTKGRIIKTNLSWSRTRARFGQLIASLSAILPQLELTKLPSLTFSAKKKYMNTNERAVNWHNLAQVDFSVSLLL